MLIIKVWQSINEISKFEDRRKSKGENITPRETIRSFVFYNNLDSSFRMISRQLDVIIIGKILGNESVGIYKIVIEISNIISRLAEPVYQAIYPEFTKMINKGKNRVVISISKKIVLISVILGSLIYLALYLYGSVIISVIFGKDFIGAYEVILYYFIAILISVVTIPITPIIFSLGLAKSAFYNQFMSTIAYLIIIYPLIINYGMVGASLAYILYYLIWSILSMKLLKRVSFL
jgi:O-antigen/teichoic acid export membrane protein